MATDPNPPVSTPTLTDQETRQRLLDAATQLFAERGFNQVTVRDICAAAGANLAAVNYYFRDKWGLYQQVLGIVIEEAKRNNEAAHAALEGATPEERLRNYMRVFLSHILGGGKECWQGKLMGREMVDPTPGLDLFIDQVIRPNSRRLGALVSEVMALPADDYRVGMCVGSIQTQLVGFGGPVAKRLIPGLEFTPEVIEALARHVAEFSLAGMRSIARRPEAEAKSESKTEVTP